MVAASTLARIQTTTIASQWLAIPYLSNCDGNDALRVSLMITTFNWPVALNLVLETVLAQSRVPDQVIVCDDGSGVETTDVVGRWKDKLPLRHVWQQDLGFRASRARNLGAAANCSDYIIWIDGDCLLPSNFIEKHVALSKPKHLIAGGRRLLSEEFTARMFTQNVAVDQAFDSWKFISFPLGYFRSIQSKSWNIVRSCNLSLYRDDLIEIGGFDESFVGWGREDSDFVIRLMNLGLKIKRGRLATCVAHLYHYDRSKSHLSINDERLARTLGDSARIYSQRSILEDK